MLRKIAAKSVTGGSFTATALGSACLGDVFWLPPRNDAIGWRAYRLVRCLQSGGMSIRELMARVANVTGTVTAATGETNARNQLSDTNHFTHDPTLVGDLLIITDDAGGSGGSPEGYSAVISYQDESGDDFIMFDTDFRLPVAPAANDTYAIRRMWKGDDAADADKASNILGVLPAAFTVNEYGYVQAFGICHVVNVSTTGPDIDGGCKAAAVGVTGDGTDNYDENIGIYLNASGSDAGVATIHIDVIYGLRGGSFANA